MQASLRIALLAAAGLLLGVSAAQAQKLYKYKDASGATVYSYTKPPDAKADEVRLLGVAAPDKQAQEKVSKDTEALDERSKERTAAAEKSAQDQEREAIIKSNCEVARKNLEILQSGSRVVETGKDGRPYFLDEKQASERLEKAKKQVEEFC